MTRIPGLDSYLTREEWTTPCDPHQPFSVMPWPKLYVHTPDLRTRLSIYTPGVAVLDDRDSELPPVVIFRGEPTLDDPTPQERVLYPLAVRYAIVRNREAPPENADGPGGQCTVCGDWHVEPR